MYKLNKLTRFLIIIVFVITFFTSFIYLWATKIEPQMIIANKKTLYIPDRNKNLNGLKIAILSDLHLGSKYIDKAKLEKIVNLTNKENPDFIFILGDIDAKLIDKNYKDINHIIQQFKKLKAVYGIYAVYGNHDYNPQNIVEPIYQKSNITLISDDFVKVNTLRGDIYIAGLRDKWGNNNESYIYKILSKVPKNETIIFLSHNPDEFPKIPYSANLIISGHNHGGQVCLPFIGGLFIPSKYGQKYLKGYIIENNKHLFVSSGIGNLAPFRLGNIPEINILQLRSQSKNKVIENTKKRTGIKTNLFYIKNSKILNFLVIKT